MIEKSKLTGKGQLALPKAIRQTLEVKEGGALIFAISKDAQVQFWPERGESRFAKYRGFGFGDLKTKAEMDDFLTTLRGRDNDISKPTTQSGKSAK